MKTQNDTGNDLILIWSIGVNLKSCWTEIKSLKSRCIKVFLHVIKMWLFYESFIYIITDVQYTPL